MFTLVESMSIKLCPGLHHLPRALHISNGFGWAENLRGREIILILIRDAKSQNSRASKFLFPRLAKNDFAAAKILAVPLVARANILCPILAFKAVRG